MTETDTIDITTRSQLQTRAPESLPRAAEERRLDPRLLPQPGCRQGGPQTDPDRAASRPDVRYRTLQGVETSGLDWAVK